VDARSGDRGGQEFFDQAIRAASRVREELPELAPEQASQLGGRLDQLLAGIRLREEGSREQAVDEVFTLLSSSPRTQRRLSELMTGLVDTRTRGDFGPLEGDPTSDYDRWVCPACSYAFPVIDVDIPPPDSCPEDGAALQLKLASG
jgi:hypothetical protein